MPFRNHLVSVLLLLIAMVGHAEPDIPSGAYKAMLVDGHLYIRIGFLADETTEQHSLKALWGADFSPEPVERIKAVDAAALTALYGAWPESFQLIYLDEGALEGCGQRAADDCREPGGEIQQAHVPVNATALYQWSCDGSLVPVLDLGPWPWQETSSWWPMVVALPSERATAYQWAASRTYLAAGKYRTELKFRHNELTLLDAMTQQLLILDWSPDEDPAHRLELKAGTDGAPLQPLPLMEIFVTPC